MGARTFDGTNDELRVAIGGCNITGAITMALIARRTDTNYNALIGLHTSGGTATYSFEVEAAADGSTLDFVGKLDWNPGVTFAAADGWCLLAVTKAAGTSTPRAHKYVYSTDTWAHSNGSSTLADQASSAGGTVRWGEWQDTDDFGGDIAVSGVWDRSLSDAEIENLAFTLQGWHASAPKGLWLFDQQATAQDVVDLTGNGANESGTGGSLVGTTVSTQSVPIWNYTDGGIQVTRSAAAAPAQDTPELRGRPFGWLGQTQMHQLLAQ